ncbi:MAG: Nif11 family protein [Microcystis aeruginosa Ma_QC_Ca_00000000_S207]|uniref:Nif11 family protein n=1 Tax=Microcystis aeruginosa Ma_QC_Ca_00000000_S207 TaxID=2486251 RepID=A0A552FI99_MICAE|nr:MAG: Nif11 family protein [Microcystis aeruginosa Ma_QC_Ca_00000000_S207]
MSIEAVREFNQIAENDPKIQQSLEATKDTQSLMNLTVELGSEKGLSFTSNDLEQYYAEESRIVPEISLRNVMFLTRPSKASKSDPEVCDRLPYLARQFCLKLNS